MADLQGDMARLDAARLDAELAALARAESGLRLRLGQALEVLGQGGHGALGFSSMSAYALERCERSSRWVEGARCLARRLEQLPALRRAVALGQLSWSMAELVVRIAKVEDEAWWLDTAGKHTVRAMRGLVKAAGAAGAHDAACNASSDANAKGECSPAEGTAAEGTAAEGTAAEGTAAEGTAAIGAAAERPSDAIGAAAIGAAAVGTAAEGTAAETPSDAQGAAAVGAASNDNGAEDEEEDGCTLTLTVDQEEVWLLESTRALLEHFGLYGNDAQLEALLAEAHVTLLGALPRGTLDDGRLKWGAMPEARTEQERRRCRAEAEALYEERIRASVLASGQPQPSQADSALTDSALTDSALADSALADPALTDSALADPALTDSALADPAYGDAALAAVLGCSSLAGMAALELDATVRALSRALAGHELELSQLVLRFHRAISGRAADSAAVTGLAGPFSGCRSGWCRLGYATEAQYARERLGMSHSALLARRALGVRLEVLPHVAEALGQGQLGVEAALQLIRIATPRTQAAWVARARQRTIKHLREEVAAALIAVRISGEADCPPPAEAELDAFHQLERAVVSGRAYGPQHAPEPNVSAPGTDVEYAARPPSAQPASAQPASAQPASAQPASAQPASAEPASVEPGCTETASVEPASVERASAQPASAEPASIEPASIEPASIEPASIEPASIEPASIEPASVEPASIEPASVDSTSAVTRSAAGSIHDPERTHPAKAASAGELGASAENGLPPSRRPVEPASEQRRAWLVMLSSLARWLEGGFQTSAGPQQAPGVSWQVPRAGRVVLRLRVSREIYALWRGLEGQAQPWLRPGTSWLKFLCLTLWRAWQHMLGPDVDYGQIYIRDRCRCTSPVCSRRDVTPHHIVFRSAGGSDEHYNINSVCTWCHLFGIHGGRIRAKGTAGYIRWELGAIDHPCLVVNGRERVAA